MTTANDEVQRVRGYLLTQANKLTIPELVEKVRNDSAAVWVAAAAVPADRLTERPGAEDWSAAEVLTHVLNMNEQGAGAIEGILAEGKLPATIRDEMRREQRDDLRMVADYQRVWTDRREELLERVLTAKGDEHLDVKITHQTFGPFSWREWLLFMRVHDLDHMRQLQAVAQQFAS
jgi:hypothetical protein